MAAAATGGTERPLEVEQSEVSSTVMREVVEEPVQRSAQDVTEVEGIDGQEMEGQMMAESERLPDYAEIMESRRSRDCESRSVIGPPLYRERDDGGDDAGHDAEADGHNRNSIGVIIGNGSSTEGSIATTARHWAFVEDERPGWA